MIHKAFNGIAKAGRSQPSPYLLDIAARQCVGDYVPLYPNPEWHHAIPYSLEKHLIFQKNGALAGFDINDPKNCVALPSNPEECERYNATLHSGRHTNAYRDGIDGLLRDWQENYQSGAMTQDQVKTEFETFLKAVRHNLDPSLNLIEGPLDPKLRANVMLYRDHPKLGTDEPFIRNLMTPPERLDCDAEQRAKHTYSYDHAPTWAEIFKQRTKAISTGLVTADQIIPAPGLRDVAEAALRHAPTLDPRIGYGLQAVGLGVTAAALAPELAVAGAVGAPVAELAAPPALRVIFGGAASASAAAAPVAEAAVPYALAASAAGLPLLAPVATAPRRNLSCPAF